jgi:dGTP triphosphohydrolase
MKLCSQHVEDDPDSKCARRPAPLPPSYQEKVAHEKLVRVACDYIAGMTDHYIQDIHKKLGAA